MWTTQERCPHGPQAHQQQQKRSIDVLPKPDNLTCCLKRAPAVCCSARMERREIQRPCTRASHARAVTAAATSIRVFLRVLVDEQSDNRVEIFLRMVFAVLIYPAAQLIDIGAFDDVGPPEHVSVVRAYESKHPGLVGLSFDHLARVPGGARHSPISEGHVGLSRGR